MHWSGTLQAVAFLFPVYNNNNNNNNHDINQQQYEFFEILDIVWLINEMFLWARKPYLV